MIQFRPIKKNFHNLLQQAYFRSILRAARSKFGARTSTSIGLNHCLCHTFSLVSTGASSSLSSIMLRAISCYNNDYGKLSFVQPIATNTLTSHVLCRTWFHVRSWSRQGALQRVMSILGLRDTLFLVLGPAFVSLASIVLRSDIVVFYIAPTTDFLRCFSTFLPRNYRCSLVFPVLFSVRMRWVLMNCVLACPCLYVQFLWSQKIYQSRAQTFTVAFLLCLPSCSKTLGV